MMIIIINIILYMNYDNISASSALTLLGMALEYTVTKMLKLESSLHVSLTATCVLHAYICDMCRKIDSSLPIRVRLLFYALYILQCLCNLHIFYCMQRMTRLTPLMYSSTHVINKMIDTI